ncbi:hypothetical protein [Kribbella sp. NPDC050470]|uniref:hypothetical protein n=1 Tax=unclassified Kribbella TaxID=2644121 RepID=UPI0037A0F687
MSSTLIAERVRWRRERQQRAKDSRRELYGQFLTSLNEAAESLWAVSLGDRRGTDGAPFDETLRGEVHRTGLYSYREQVMILAPEGVRASADQAVDRVREYRDCLMSGSQTGSPVETAAMNAYKAAVKSLRQAMRSDLER